MYVSISGECLGLIQCHGKSRAIQCRYIISIYGYLLFVCIHAFIYFCGTFYIFPILLSMNCHSDNNTIDGHIAGNRRPYPDIFQRYIKYPRVHELCQTYSVVEA